MSDELQQWEYRAQTVGSFWSGVKDAELQDLLNAWGAEGWEVVGFRLIENSNQAQLIAKRPLTRAVLRQRSMPKH